jgi:endonuclease YncB( thermonuclease family)
MRLLLAIPLLFIFPSAVLAHGGGLNAEGCHNDRKRGGYHCHRASSAPAPRAQPARIYSAPARNLYANCSIARAAGVAPIYRGQRGYGTHLDRDSDGVACETGGASAGTTSTRAVPTPRTAPVLVVEKPQPVFSAQGSSFLPIPIEGVAQVLDGDTIQIGLTRIRFYGIDAFESEQMCKTSEDNVYGCGGRATRALTEKIEGQLVTCVPKGKDAYDRQLALCRIESTNLSSWMARNGHALAYTKYAYDYISDEAYAQKHKEGAWGGSFQVPWEFRQSRPRGAAEAQRSSVAPSANCTIKGNVNKDGKRIYHLQDDPYYARTKPENWFCSTGEAEAAGFRRAGTVN